MHALEIAAVVVTGTMVGNELAVAVFLHPGISRLDDTTHVRAAQTLAQALGRVMPFWYALTLILSLGVVFVARPAWTAAWWLALGAAALFVAVIVYISNGLVGCLGGLPSRLATKLTFNPAWTLAPTDTSDTVLEVW